MQAVAFLGLGKMGAAMAGNIAAAGLRWSSAWTVTAFLLFIRL